MTTSRDGDNGEHGEQAEQAEQAGEARDGAQEGAQEQAQLAAGPRQDSGLRVFFVMLAGILIVLAIFLVIGLTVLR